MRLVYGLSLASIAISACATRPVIPSPPSGIPVSVPDTTQEPSTGKLRLSPGTTLYDFMQTAEVRLEGSTDTEYSTIKTDALLSVVVTAAVDSTYEILVSVDSVFITPAGTISTRAYPPVSLGPILRLRSGTPDNHVEVLLPDSLCAHAQLVATARELVLPPLPKELPTQRRQSWVDSVQFVACPAGSRVNTIITRQIQDLGTQPTTELTVTGTSILSGAGILRTDSITVTGSVKSRGKVFMREGSRLPTLVEATSEGRILVRLGDSTTVFRQVSTHQIRQRQPN